MKKCTGCNIEKPKSFFVKRKDRPSGITSLCLECNRKRGRKNYYENREKEIERVKNYWEKNRDKRNELSQRFRDNNPGYYTKYFREYDKKRRNYKKQMEYKRRARAKNQLGNVSDDIVDVLYAEQSGRCRYCHMFLRDSFHLEHKIPLSRGGLHDDENLCLSCPSCNLSKGVKTEKEFIGV